MVVLKILCLEILPSNRYISVVRIKISNFMRLSDHRGNGSLLKIGVKIMSNLVEDQKSQRSYEAYNNKLVGALYVNDINDPFCDEWNLKLLEFSEKLGERLFDEVYSGLSYGDEENLIDFKEQLQKIILNAKKETEIEFLIFQLFQRRHEFHYNYNFYENDPNNVWLTFVANYNRDKFIDVFESLDRNESLCDILDEKLQKEFDL